MEIITSYDRVRLIFKESNQERWISKELLECYPNSVFSLYLKSNSTNNISIIEAPSDMTIENYDKILSVLEGRQKYTISGEATDLLSKYGFIQNLTISLSEMMLAKVRPVIDLVTPFVNGSTNYLFCNKIKEYKKFKKLFSEIPNIVPVQVVTSSLMPGKGHSLPKQYSLYNYVILSATYDNGIPLYDKLNRDSILPVENEHVVRNIPSLKRLDPVIRDIEWDLIYFNSALNDTKSDFITLERLKQRQITYPPFDAYVSFYSEDETEFLTALIELYGWYDWANEYRTGGGSDIPNIIGKDIAITKGKYRSSIFSALKDIDYRNITPIKVLNAPQECRYCSCDPRSIQSTCSTHLYVQDIKGFLGFIRLE